MGLPFSTKKRLEKFQSLVTHGDIQGFVIDAVVNITSMNVKYKEDARLFSIFLSEIKFKGVHSFTKYCDDLATTMALYAGSSSSWREEVYKNTLFLELAVELAESFSEVKKIHGAKRK